MVRKELSCGIACYGEYLKVSVSYNEKTLSFSKKLINFDDVMVAQVKRLTERLGFDMKDIRNLCVVRGPGRFTAIRSVYTFASVLKVLVGCKVYGVDTFGVLAYNLFKDDKTDKDIAVVLHAFKDEYYLAVYRIKNRRLFEVKKPLWLFIDELLQRLEEFKGIVVYDKEEFDFDFSRLKNKKISIAPKRYLRIIPENIIDAALYFKSSEFEPIYLKPAKFEVR